MSSQELAFGGPGNKKAYVGNEIQNKEFADGSGLELYDFNARTYDQQMGRFIQIDPLSEEADQEGWSPYHYSYDNPVTYSDPDGMCPCFIIPILQGLVAAGGATVGTYVVVKSYQNSDLADMDLSINLPAVKKGSAGSGEAVITGPSYTMGTTGRPAYVNDMSANTQSVQAGGLGNSTRLLAKARSKSDEALIKQAAEQKAKEEAAKLRAQKKQQQTQQGNQKQGKSNQGTKGSHDSGSKSKTDKQTHETAEARRAREQAAAENKKKQSKAN